MRKCMSWASDCPVGVDQPAYRQAAPPATPSSGPHPATGAESVGLRFQQIQKYECGANGVAASRLHEFSVALNVPVSYFFKGLQQHPAPQGAINNDGNLLAFDVLSQKETLDLIRVYYKLGARAAACWNSPEHFRMTRPARRRRPVRQRIETEMAGQRRPAI